jgi:hypothetical protein
MADLSIFDGDRAALAAHLRDDRYVNGCASFAKCPCCGGELAGAELRWNYEARTLVGERGAVVFSLHQAKLFNLLWHSRQASIAFDGEALFYRMYGHRDDGGPKDLNVIRVYLHYIRRAIAPFGITICKGSNDPSYRLVRKHKEMSS